MDDIKLPFFIYDTTTYHLVRKVATGGMGSVYEADQLGSEGFTKRVAIKTILPKYTDNRDFVDMFIGEAKLVAGLVHQNIVQIYQLGKFQDGYFIAMEYINGVNLEQFMDRHLELGRRIPVDIATFIVSRICRGLEYAHGRTDEDGNQLGIVHRDVSPKNIMITSEGEAKLADWGIAKARRFLEQKEGDVLMGKVEYMSPEQASYEETDGRSDLFSLGTVFLELLTGINVFMCDDVFDTIDKVKECKVPDVKSMRKDVPDELCDIVYLALQRRRAKRYQTAGDMGYALEYFMYRDGYGPTIVKLAKYMAEIFPDSQIYRYPKREGHFSPTDLDTRLRIER